MTSGESAELARQIVRITQANLPLVGGLRAMAEEIPSRRFRAAALELAQRLELGESLDAALDAMSPRLPAHLCAVVRAGVQADKLGELLAEYVHCHGLNTQLKRRSIASLAYPALLFLVFVSVFSLLVNVIVPAFRKIFGDFGVELPSVTLSLLVLSDWFHEAWPWFLVVCTMLALGGWLAARWFLGPPARQRMVYRIPLIGAFKRQVALAQFARILGLLVESELPLPTALRLAGSGVRDAEVGDAANQLAREVESGLSLEHSQTRKTRFPGGLAQCLQPDANVGRFAESLRTAAEMLEGQTFIHSEFVFRVAPPLTMIFIVLVLGYVLTGLFLPVMSGINSLGG